MKQEKKVKVIFATLDPIYMVLTLAAFILAVISLKRMDIKAFILSFIICMISANNIK